MLELCKMLVGRDKRARSGERFTLFGHLHGMPVLGSGTTLLGAIKRMLQ